MTVGPSQITQNNAITELDQILWIPDAAIGGGAAQIFRTPASSLLTSARLRRLLGQIDYNSLANIPDFATWLALVLQSVRNLSGADRIPISAIDLRGVVAYLEGLRGNNQLNYTAIRNRLTVGNNSGFDPVNLANNVLVIGSADATIARTTTGIQVGPNSLTNAHINVNADIHPSKIRSPTRNQVAVFDNVGYLTPGGLAINRLPHLSTLTENVQNAIDSLRTELQTALAGARDFEPVRVATTENINFTVGTRAGAIIDDVTLVVGDRILIKDQTDLTRNGLYVVTSTTQPATRTADAQFVNNLVGASVFVREGTENNHASWICVIPQPPVPNVVFGTTDIRWIHRFSVDRDIQLFNSPPIDSVEPADEFGVGLPTTRPVFTDTIIHMDAPVRRALSPLPRPAGAWLIYSSLDVETIILGAIGETPETVPVPVASPRFINPVLTLKDLYRNRDIPIVVLINSDNRTAYGRVLLLLPESLGDIFLSRPDPQEGEPRAQHNYRPIYRGGAALVNGVWWGSYTYTGIENIPINADYFVPEPGPSTGRKPAQFWFTFPTSAGEGGQEVRYLLNLGGYLLQNVVTGDNVKTATAQQIGSYLEKHNLQGLRADVAALKKNVTEGPLAITRINGRHLIAQSIYALLGTTETAFNAALETEEYSLKVEINVPYDVSVSDPTALLNPNLSFQGAATLNALGTNVLTAGLQVLTFSIQKTAIENLIRNNRLNTDGEGTIQIQLLVGNRNPQSVLVSEYFTFSNTYTPDGVVEPWARIGNPDPIPASKLPGGGDEEEASTETHILEKRNAGGTSTKYRYLRRDPRSAPSFDSNNETVTVQVDGDLRAVIDGTDRLMDRNTNLQIVTPTALMSQLFARATSFPAESGVDGQLLGDIDYYRNTVGITVPAARWDEWNAYVGNWFAAVAHLVPTIESAEPVMCFAASLSGSARAGGILTLQVDRNFFDTSTGRPINRAPTRLDWATSGMLFTPLQVAHLYWDGTTNGGLSAIASTTGYLESLTPATRDGHVFIGTMAMGNFNSRNREFAAYRAEHVFKPTRRNFNSTIWERAGNSMVCRGGGVVNIDGVDVEIAPGTTWRYTSRLNIAAGRHTAYMTSDRRFAFRGESEGPPSWSEYGRTFRQYAQRPLFDILVSADRANLEEVYYPWQRYATVGEIPLEETVFFNRAGNVENDYSESQFFTDGRPETDSTRNGGTGRGAYRLTYKPGVFLSSPAISTQIMEEGMVGVRQHTISPNDITLVQYTTPDNRSNSRDFYVTAKRAGIDLRQANLDNLYKG